MFFHSANPPCKGCKSRSTTCHLYCGKYKIYRAEIEDQNRADNARIAIADVRTESLLKYRERARKCGFGKKGANGND